MRSGSRETRGRHGAAGWCRRICGGNAWIRRLLSPALVSARSTSAFPGSRTLREMAAIPARRELPTTEPATAAARPDRPAEPPRSASHRRRVRRPGPSPLSPVGEPRNRALGKWSGSSLAADQPHRCLPTLGRASARARSPSKPAPDTAEWLPSWESSSPRERSGGPGGRRSARRLLISDAERVAQPAAEVERRASARRWTRAKRRGRARTSEVRGWRDPRRCPGSCQRRGRYEASRLLHLQSAEARNRACSTGSGWSHLQSISAISAAARAAPSDATGR